MKETECDICGKVCAHYSALMRHKRKHTKEKPYKCEKCNRSFSLMSSFYTHWILHTGEFPFTCEICDKSCQTKLALISHLKLHTEKSPFKCKKCLETFSGSKVLSDHMQCHIIRNPFKCKECAAPFYSYARLFQHMKRNCKLDEVPAKKHRRSKTRQKTAAKEKGKNQTSSSNMVSDRPEPELSESYIPEVDDNSGKVYAQALAIKQEVAHESYPIPIKSEIVISKIYSCGSSGHSLQPDSSRSYSEEGVSESVKSNDYDTFPQEHEFPLREFSMTSSQKHEDKFTQQDLSMTNSVNQEYASKGLQLISTKINLYQLVDLIKKKQI